MKSKFTYLITMLILMAFSLGQLSAQDIVYVTDDLLEAPNIQFLKNQGFNVTTFWQSRDINLVSQDSIDMLNNADLVIFGRSGPSTSFQDSAERVTWNNITAPVLLICPWKARSSRLNWFNSSTSNQINVSTGTTDGIAVVPGDAVFDDVTLEADNSLTWSWLADDYILVKEFAGSNGEWIVNRGDTIPLLVRFEPDVPFYEGAKDSAAGPRSYMGMGNDANGPSNFFPLSLQAKKIYLAEICRLMGIPAQEIVYSPVDYRIRFVTDDLLEMPNINWLKAQGFQVNTFWQSRDIQLVSQDSIDMLNRADLVIFGRSGPSTSFQDSAERVTWNNLTAPVLLICPWKARSSRLNWFNSSTSNQINVSEGTTLGYAVVPADDVFADVTLEADNSLTWSWLADDYILVKEFAGSNGEWIVNRGDTIPLLVRFEPDVPFYEGAKDSAKGPRSYMGMGNDANGPSNFFPLSREAKKIYLAEICRLMDAPVPEITYTAIDYTVTVVSDDDFDKPCITFLNKQGFRNVKTFWQSRDINLVSQDSIDILNNSDLVIIGRSGPSTSFQDSAERVTWNNLTAPVILNCPWKARSSRLKWFNSSTSNQINQPEGTTTAVALDLDDPVFEFAPGIAVNGNIPEWSFLADDYILVKEFAGSNGEWVVNRGDTIPLVVRFEPNVQFYEGAGDSAAAERVYFGMGNDANGPNNFFPLTQTAQAIYFAEAMRLLGAPAYEPVYLGTDRTLATLAVSVGTLTPAFDKETLEYTVDLPEGTAPTDSIEVTATATEATSVVTGAGWVKVPNLTNSATITCTAENANPRYYKITFNRPTGVEETATTTSSCDIYPNPVNDKVVISATDVINSVTIYNLQGAAIVTRIVDSRNVELSVSNLNAGIYFVKVQSGDNVYVSKITKN
jgi:hypothetical protein